MEEAQRAEIQGREWTGFTGPEFLEALRDGTVERISFHDNGVRFRVKTPEGAATWDIADAPSADKFLPSPS